MLTLNACVSLLERRSSALCVMEYINFKKKYFSNHEIKCHAKKYYQIKSNEKINKYGFGDI